MAGEKRTKGSFDGDNYFGKPSNSKRVRFDRESSTDFEIDHEGVLESAKRRRGALEIAELSDDEEVGGGVFSDSEDESEEETNKGKGPAAPEGEIDMFADTPVEPVQPQGAKKKKKRTLELNDIEGQELDSHNRSSDEDESDGEGGRKREPKLSAFNMKEEMEEGSFDQNGNYIRNKADPHAFHDQWMEGVSRKDIARAREAHERREREENLKEATRQADLPQTQTDIYKELVEYLSPGDTVREALTKLGNSTSQKIPAWKQKLMEKKNKNKKPSAAAANNKPLTEAEEKERQRKVEKITGLADQMMGLGYFGIYDETFETMVRHLRREGVVPEDWLPPSCRQ